MKRTALLIAIAFIASTILTSCSNKNALAEGEPVNSIDSATAVAKEQSVELQWTKVELAYQKRAALVTDIVNAVKDITGLEQVLTEIIIARSEASSVNINAEMLNEETIAKFQYAQDELSEALDKLIADQRLQTVEELKNLTNDLKEIESEIFVQRNAYNETATNYNMYTSSLPGFEKKGCFK